MSLWDVDSSIVAAEASRKQDFVNSYTGDPDLLGYLPDKA